MKRFVETKIWQEKWYRELPCKYKEFWRFLCENCEAGLWEKDIELASFFIGEEIDGVEFLQLINKDKERIRVLEDGKWFVVKFIEFQYGKLSWKIPPHRLIIKTLIKYKLFDILKENSVIDNLPKEYIDLIQSKEEVKTYPKEGVDDELSNSSLTPSLPLAKGKLTLTLGEVKGKPTLREDKINPIGEVKPNPKVELNEELSNPSLTLKEEENLKEKEKVIQKEKEKEAAAKEDIDIQEKSKRERGVGKRGKEEEVTIEFRDGEFRNITKEILQKWEETYPACNIEHELRKMREWVLSNPNKKKRNWRRFITNWLTRQQERGGSKFLNSYSYSMHSPPKNTQSTRESEYILVLKDEDGKILGYTDIKGNPVDENGNPLQIREG